MPNISDIILKCEERENMMPNEGFEEIAELLQSLLDQPEGEPVAIVERFRLEPTNDIISVQLPAGTKLYTHPSAPLEMPSDDEFNEVDCHPITGKDAIKAFCAKHNLTLEKK